jgi:hypothetical protein
MPEAAVRVAQRVDEPALIDHVVSKLCEIERRTGIDRTLAIGELILSQFFGGDAAVWRDRRRNKNNSIRRLADRSDCPLCRSALGEAVAVYVASLQMPCVRTFGHIGGSHVACVLHLCGKEREALLEQAERERLSVRELRKRVASLRKSSGERRGRPALRSAGSAAQVAADYLQKGIESLKTEATVPDSVRPRLRALAGELLMLAGEPVERSRKPGV